MKYSKFVIFGLLSLVMGLVACSDPDTLFEENKPISEGNWDAEQVFKFETAIPDTTNGYNVYLNLRNSGSYPYSNIFLFVNTYFPSGTIDKDTVEIMLASPEGKWLGRGLGDIWDNRILFKRNVTFPEKGKYRFEISQAMRLNPLPGITDAGIRIEKVK
ncbi:MAG: gliding motility lipoprotein GldH [Bacteroidota bacterium]